VTVAPTPPAGTDPEPGRGATVASRLQGHLRSGGAFIPLLTLLFAFLVGGLVVLFTGGNPLTVYEAIFNGAGLNWLFPWVTGVDREIAGINLQQTLINTTPLILTGLAVAYAFRSGLFNIGGQGQYAVGAIVAVWVGSSWAGMPGVLHIVLTMVLATLAGAAWGAIAGGLRAATGANEVITTIMLNWIAIWVSIYLFGLGGPLQSPEQRDVPVSSDVVPDARLPVFWGDPELQGLHIGIFIALAAAVVYWVVLNRSATGYEARAVGFNPEAARYSGIRVGKTYLLTMGLCGAAAGLAGSLDLLGWQFRIATNDVQVSTVGFLGIAVALLGRNTALGVVLSALLFGALLTGTSVRNLDPTIFEPEAAQNLTTIIQGLVILLVTADVLIIALLNRLRRRGPTDFPSAPVRTHGAGAG
jgi:simple sugar transport system permease protein